MVPTWSSVLALLARWSITCPFLELGAIADQSNEHGPPSPVACGL
jgi:hypothetical protein